jgi:hypothetical protein
MLRRFKDILYDFPAGGWYTPGFYFRRKKLQVSARHISTTYHSLFNKFNYSSKKFLYGRVSKRAHNNLGHYTVFSRGWRKKAKFLNYINNNSYIGLNYFAMPIKILRDRHNVKFGVILINCLGESIVAPYTTNMQLFCILFGGNISQYLRMWHKSLKYFFYFDHIMYLPRFACISYFSDSFYGRIKFSKATGSSSLIWSQTVMSKYGPMIMIWMGSGDIKLLNSYVMAFGGTVESLTKKKFKNTRAGFWRRSGRKPTVRGNVKNPVDHPHGGRERTILCPVTPWGKVTKLK